MGNTILAHVLYSCNQIDFNIESLFSPTGDAHKMRNLNKTPLFIWDQPEYLLDDNVIKILTVHYLDWYEVLRHKFSYEKWVGDYPTIENFNKFGFLNPHSGTSWLENLTITYYDMLQSADQLPTGPVLLLSDYLAYQIDSIKTLASSLNWKWNEDKSIDFYNQAINTNKKYLIWLDNFKSITQKFVTGELITIETLQFWECAMILAKYCYITKTNPTMLAWDRYDCQSLNSVR